MKSVGLPYSAILLLAVCPILNKKYKLYEFYNLSPQNRKK